MNPQRNKIIIFFFALFFLTAPISASCTDGDNQNYYNKDEISKLLREQAVTMPLFEKQIVKANNYLISNDINTDRWLAYIGLLLAIVGLLLAFIGLFFAFVSVIIPLLFSRHLREEYKIKREETKKMLIDITNLTKQSENYTEVIEKNPQQFREIPVAAVSADRPIIKEQHLIMNEIANTPKAYAYNPLFALPLKEQKNNNRAKAISSCQVHALLHSEDENVNFESAHSLANSTQTELIDKQQFLVLNKTIDICYQMTKSNQNSCLAFNNLANALSQQAEKKSGDEADRLFELACQNYAEAIRIKPDYNVAYNNWGLALLNQAEKKSGDEADRLFELAYQKYAEAISIKPVFHKALHFWSTTLTRQAKTKSGDEAHRLFELAYQKYAEAIRIKPDCNLLNDWGISLSQQAEKKSGDEADRLFELAYQKYAEAISIKPDCYIAYNNWGLALLNQAEKKSGDEADRLFELAYQNYAEAIRIKPDCNVAYNNWGHTLLNQAKTKSGDEADCLFELAFAKCSMAEYFFPGVSSYNLACICALTGKLDASRLWLIDSKEKGRLPSGKHIKEDSDLNPIKDLQWFKTLISEVCN